jgi:hypothetical protein
MTKTLTINIPARSVQLRSGVKRQQLGRHQINSLSNVWIPFMNDTLFAIALGLAGALFLFLALS